MLKAARIAANTRPVRCKRRTRDIAEASDMMDRLAGFPVMGRWNWSPCDVRPPSC
jgi:hypothetical protein